MLSSKSYRVTFSFLMVISVVLPTLNGELFLFEQLSSLVNQECPNIVEIHIRDDGSSDNTLAVLSKFPQHTKIHADSLGRLGTCGSILQILSQIPTSELVIFCDQDDIWENNHVDLATRTLHHVDKPAMMIAGHTLIDEVGHTIGLKSLPSVDFHKNCLIENVATGSGLAINRAGLDLIRRVEFNPLLHFDHQLYIVFAFLGRIYIPNQRTIRYRIHQNNQVGVAVAFPSKILSFYKALRYQTLKRNLDLIEGFIFSNSNLFESSDLYREVESVLYSRRLKFIDRVKSLRRLKISRLYFTDSVAFYALFLFGRM